MLVSLVRSTTMRGNAACCLRLLVSSAGTCGDTACCLRLLVSSTSTCGHTACRLKALVFVQGMVVVVQVQVVIRGGLNRLKVHIGYKFC